VCRTYALNGKRNACAVRKRNERKDGHGTSETYFLTFFLAYFSLSFSASLPSSMMNAPRYPQLLHSQIDHSCGRPEAQKTSTAPHFGQNFTPRFPALRLDLASSCFRKRSASVELKLNPCEDLIFCSIKGG